MSNIKSHYKNYVIPALWQEFKYSNIHKIPKLKKININTGLGLKAQNNNFLQKAIEEMRLITGQHPIITKAKKSIAGFKIRENSSLGLMVTLRREKMYAFFERFITLVLPRIRDFRGLSTHNFDHAGNYNIGLSEQLVFPEIDFDTLDECRGFNVTIVTTATNVREGSFLLKLLGFPFALN